MHVCFDIVINDLYPNFTSDKWSFNVLFRCVHIAIAGATCRSGADTRGERMAAEEPDSCPNSLAETDQPRGRRTTLSGISKQGEAS